MVDEKYVEMLKNPDISYNRIIDYIKTFMPQYFYKYRVFGEYWEDEVFNGNIFMCKAKDFNDPYDSVYSIDVNKYFDNLTQRIGFDLRNFAKDKKGFDNVAYTEINCAKGEFQNYIRASSFSEDGASILMWSHYAVNHTGFCIQYDMSELHKPHNRIFMPVVYDECMYDATDILSTRNPNLSFNPVLFKAREWEYEKEWRFVGNANLYNDEKGEHLHLKDFISGVYLGARCNDQEKIDKILQWGKAKEIPIYKMKMQQDKFVLKPERID